MEYLKNFLEFLKFIFFPEIIGERYWKLKKERDKAYEQGKIFKVMELEKEMENQEILDDIKRSLTGPPEDDFDVAIQKIKNTLNDLE